MPLITTDRRDERNLIVDIPLWLISEFPVVTGVGQNAVIVSYDEIERDGRKIGQMPEGEWFATITSNEDGDGLVVATGWVEHQGVGATCIHLNRAWDNAYWIAQDTKVMPIPKPFIDADDVE